MGGHHVDRDKMGCAPETLRRWVRQQERDTGQRQVYGADKVGANCGVRTLIWPAARWSA